MNRYNLPQIKQYIVHKSLENLLFFTDCVVRDSNSACHHGFSLDSADMKGGDGATSVHRMSHLNRNICGEKRHALARVL